MFDNIIKVSETQTTIQEITTKFYNRNNSTGKKLNNFSTILFLPCMELGFSLSQKTYKNSFNIITMYSALNVIRIKQLFSPGFQHGLPIYEQQKVLLLQ